ncbi:hypothetical protein NDU88_003278 [Pleurodeles waltl]|uniref:Uncharacterized protein n=1 Tax=Pleurodeles waltl TaxID=8319 RepID=A0AAV7LEU8_PLEWA|nr:hypothetical protein NDU88_003278 [Pleurodeles waltl]
MTSTHFEGSSERRRDLGKESGTEQWWVGRTKPTKLATDFCQQERRGRPNQIKRSADWAWRGETGSDTESDEGEERNGGAVDAEQEKGEWKSDVDHKKLEVEERKAGADTVRQEEEEEKRHAHI